MFNPTPRINEIDLGEGQRCLVVDDALTEPERWRRFAVAHAAEFEDSPHNAYPGPELRLPETVSAQLETFFAQHIRRRLGIRRTLRMYSRMALTTRRVEQLQPRQWLCHRDRMDIAAGECVAASVLYLFDQPELGGTSFFRPLRPGFETDLLVHESGQLAPQAFTAKYGIRPGYMTDSNAWFERVTSVPARWNRLIFYDGMVFHSGDLRALEALSADPSRGRLTLNGFFTCRPAAG